MSVRAVDRAIAILQAFSAERPLMSVIDIQKCVGLTRPTLYRLLNTLARRGLIQSEGDPLRFKLAHGVMSLAHTWLSTLDMVNTARPIVEGLRETTGETTALFKLQDDRAVCVLEYQSRHELSISRGIGASLSIAQGATGRAMLAFIERDAQAGFIEQMPRNAQRARLERELATTRQHGYATSRSEIVLGAIAISAPYFDHHGLVAGSVGLYGSSARVSEDQVEGVARLVVDAGRKISSLLGFQENEEGNQAPAPKSRQPSRVRRVGGAG
ncbi:MAG: IclR family transcriptional regulator [Zoogloeaceae bacterium]|jgi:DNA-binding IclR family transcriptional regulator|nr:IclR family transcriptional regulator [Zoogloeaceae bacterium]